MTKTSRIIPFWPTKSERNLEEFTVTRCEILGQPVSFCTNRPKDYIQRIHRRGTFYEMSELSWLRRLVDPGGTFFDIGANVGNHSLFAGKFLGFNTIVPIEPNPLAYQLLKMNVDLNHLIDMFDLSHLGIGLSDERVGGYAMQKRKKNLGGARMLPGQGELEVFRADDRLKDYTPTLIKIDVEGMEMNVLNGLSGILRRATPLIMVEIGRNNVAAFATWRKDNGYAVLTQHKRHHANENYFIVPQAALQDYTQRLARDPA